MTIPKIIHQTYRSAAAVPEAFRPGIAELRAMNPGWDYRFYDDAAVAAFIRDEFRPEYYQAFCRLNPAFGPARADFFRYLVIKTGDVHVETVIHRSFLFSFSA